jgi:glycosyltransferase involved in cell wall biosynthesis
MAGDPHLVAIPAEWLDQMPNVLHAIDTGGPGGAENLFAQLVDSLARRGYAPMTSVPYEGWLHGKLRDRQVPVQVIPSKGGFSLSYLRALLALIRSQRIELIHSHLLGSNVYCSLAGRIAGIPVVSVFHGLPDISGHNSVAWLKRRILLMRHDHIVSVSENLVGALCRWGIPRTKIRVIRNGIDVGKYLPGTAPHIRREFGVGDGEILVGAVGNIRKAKGYERLIEAAALALQRQPNLKFVVAGQGSPEALGALRDQVARRGLSARMQFLGFYPSSADLLRAFDIFVSSSVTEGLPLSFLEAMACGIPVAATTNGGSEEVLQGGAYGRLASDPEGLAAALVDLSRDPAERARLGAVGRERAVRDFDWSDTVDAYAELYAQLIQGS